MNKKIKKILNKKNKSKIVCLTAYSKNIAEILDKHCDLVLVGDSLGMTVYGHNNTLSVTKRMMIDHGKCVVANSRKALVVVDLPFGSYQGNSREALNSAIRIMKETGAHAVKLEGGSEIIDSVERIISAGIPVMGHVGLTPQSFHQLSG